MGGIADYTFLRRLGSGPHGESFLAQPPARLGVAAEHVVVKVYRRESTSEGFRRILARLRAFAAVRTPYLVGLHDTGQHDGLVYVGEEYVAGGSLLDGGAALPPGLRLRAVGDAARAAAALHLAGVVHGGIRPGNLLLDLYGGKLAEPDLGQILAPGLIGPDPYADPARLLGEPPAPEHDVWSIGVLAHHALTGEDVGADAPPSTGLAALRTAAAYRPLVSTAIPEPVAGIVRDCFAPAGQRPSAAVVAERLAAAAADLAGAPAAT